MLKETTLYTAICDRCDKEFEHNYNTESVLESELNLANWHDTGQLHFCPECYTIDENNELKLKPPINNQDNEQ